MNKSELIKTLAESKDLHVDEASDIVNAFIESIKQALVNEDRVEIRGFGSFKIKNYKGYTAATPNPATWSPWPPRNCRSSAPARNSRNSSTSNRTVFLKHLLHLLGLLLSGPALGVGHDLGAPSLMVFFTANTHGAFSPCPT